MPFRGAFSQLFTQDDSIAAVVFLLVVVALGTALLLGRRRRRRGQEPSQRAEANRLEIGYVALLVAIVAFLVASSFLANAREFPAARPAVRVQVVAFQWCWQFRYEGQPVTVTGSCQGGSFPTLVLPAGQPVELDVTSIDVVHAFWLPYLRFKMNAYPGHVNAFTTTLTRTGRWLGRGAQLCGLYHYEMDFYVQVVSPDSFGRFLQAHGGRA
jgi:cytochrome c oxidase subunit 2